jgi:hypothetical protein
MSTFKKYLKIISESDGYSDTPDITKEKALEEFSKEFLTKEKIKELREKILTDMYKETGKNEEIELIFPAESASMATNIKNLIKNEDEKKTLLKLFKEKLFTNNDDIDAINIINQYNIRNISFDNIITSIYPNQFKLKISFNSDSYEKQNQTRIKGSAAIGKTSPPPRKPEIYKGPENNEIYRGPKNTGPGNYGKLFYNPFKSQSQPKKKK